MFKSNAESLGEFDGIVINSFDCLEAEALEALRTGKLNNKSFDPVQVSLPPIFNVGLIPHEFETNLRKGTGTEAAMKWLEGRPARSVVYVSFGSRTTLPRDQIRELGKGLIGSGVPFIWVVKDAVVDQDDEERIEGVLGEEMMGEVMRNGIVVKEWVDQAQVLGHESIGGFLSHCGWNSIVEAAWFGVPILGWPPHGDQKINGEVGEEIRVRIKDMMHDDKLRKVVDEIKEQVRKDVHDGGSLKQLVEKLSR
ncbi:UDP-glycosyltransferase 708G1 [Linum perenne]